MREFALNVAIAASCAALRPTATIPNTTIVNSAANRSDGARDDRAIGRRRESSRQRPDEKRRRRDDERGVERADDDGRGERADERHRRHHVLRVRHRRTGLRGTHVHVRASHADPGEPRPARQSRSVRAPRHTRPNRCSATGSPSCLRPARATDRCATRTSGRRPANFPGRRRAVAVPRSCAANSCIARDGRAHFPPCNSPSRPPSRCTAYRSSTRGGWAGRSRPALRPAPRCRCTRVAATSCVPRHCPRLIAPATTTAPIDTIDGEPRRAAARHGERRGHRHASRDADHDRRRTARRHGHERDDGNADRAQVSDEVPVAERSSGRAVETEVLAPQTVRLSERRDGTEYHGGRERREERARESRAANRRRAPEERRAAGRNRERPLRRPRVCRGDRRRETRGEEQHHRQIHDGQRDAGESRRDE